MWQSSSHPSTEKLTGMDIKQQIGGTHTIAVEKEVEGKRPLKEIFNDKVIVVNLNLFKLPKHC